MMKLQSSLLLSALALCLMSPLASASARQTNNPNETPAQRDARMKWWHEARFGMFIHWGLYAVPAGIWKGQETSWIGEWIMNSSKIPVAEYAALAKQFDPEQFNAESWVKLAKAAGMKYIVITAKHHDGFAMFHTKVDGYNIFDATPFHRDPLKELAAACKKEGIKLGFYYSQSQDWHHAGGYAYNGGHWDPAQNGSYDDYLKNVAAPQVKELLTEYGPVSVIWWDTPGDMTPERAALFSPLLKLQPKIISNDRLGSLKGDYGTPEQTIPAKGLGHDWETCMTINDTWGYKVNDHNFKSTAVLLHNLIDVASKGGNYLLNVGPDATGVIPPDEAQRLLEVGTWLKANGEAVYGTSASPFNAQLSWGRGTQKAGKLYLTVFDWPTDGQIHVPVLNPKVRAHLLSSPKDILKTTSDSSGLTIQVPDHAPDALASVIVVEPVGPLQVAGPPPPVLISPTGAGAYQLTASNAALVGDAIKVEGDDVKNIGYWTNATDYVTWRMKVDKPGTYNVAMTYSDDTVASDSEFTLSTGNRTLSGVVKSTGSWSAYQTTSLGTIEINQLGAVTLTLKVIKMPHGAVMNLRAVVLDPVR